MPVLSGVFNFAPQQLGTHRMCLQRWLFRTRRRHMCAMRRRNIQKSTCSGVMHALRGRIILNRSWCHDMYKLSGKLEFSAAWIFGSQQLHVQPRLHGAKYQLCSVSSRDIQNCNRKCSVHDVSLVFRRVVQCMHRSGSV